MESLIEQIILQMPVVAVLLFIVFKQEKRMDDLMDSVLNCLNSQKKTENDHTYTYPEK